MISISSDSLKIENSLKKDYESMTESELQKVINTLRKHMNEASVELKFEEAAFYRDKIKEIKEYLDK